MTIHALPTARESTFVSIGLPVYNGAQYLREAIESLLAQTHQNFELLIADNASSDETPAICREFAERDSRISYTRHSENRGATYNFQFVLNEARGDYFMWAAHDDWWEPEFVAANLHELLADPSVIASISQVEFIGEHSWLWSKCWAPFGTTPLMGSTAANVLRFLWNPGTVSRVYSLFRTDVLRRSFDSAFYWGSDSPFAVRTLRFGKYAEVPRPLMHRRRGVSSNIRQFVLKYNPSRLSRILPFWDATRDIVKQDHVPKGPLTYLILMRLNLLHAAWYYKTCLQDLGSWLAHGIGVAGRRLRAGNSKVPVAKA